MRFFKKLLLLNIIGLILIIDGCSKKDDSSSNNTTPPAPTALQMTILDASLNPIPYATVQLFTNETDWNNGTNQYGSTQIADANGVVTFTNMSSLIKYYYYAEKDCKNNVNGIYAMTDYITENTTKKINVILTSTGTLSFKNVSSNPYHVYINGSFAFDMNGGTQRSYYYILTGTYTVRILQISGYVLYPTDQTFGPFNLNCGSNMQTTFPQ